MGDAAGSRLFVGVAVGIGFTALRAGEAADPGDVVGDAVGEAVGEVVAVPVGVGGGDGEGDVVTAFSGGGSGVVPVVFWLQPAKASGTATITAPAAATTLPRRTNRISAPPPRLAHDSVGPQ